MVVTNTVALDHGLARALVGMDSIVRIISGEIILAVISVVSPSWPMVTMYNGRICGRSLVIVGVAGFQATVRSNSSVFFDHGRLIQI